MKLWPATLILAILSSSGVGARAEDVADTLATGFYFAESSTVVKAGKIPDAVLQALRSELEQCGFRVTGPACADSQFVVEEEGMPEEKGDSFQFFSVLATADGSTKVGFELESNSNPRNSAWKSVRVLDRERKQVLLNVTPAAGSPWEFIQRRASLLTSARELSQWIQYSLWRRAEQPDQAPFARSAIAALLARYGQVANPDGNSESDLLLNQLVMDLRAEAQTGKETAVAPAEFGGGSLGGVVTAAQVEESMLRLVRSKGVPADRAVIKRGLRSDDVNIRIRAVPTFRLLRPTPREAMLLIPILKDPVQQLRASAYEQLILLKLPEASLPKLAELAEVPAIQPYAFTLLLRMNLPAADAILFKFVRDPNRIDAARYALNVLKSRRDPKLAGIFLEAIASNDRDLARVAYEALSDIKLDDSHLPAISQLPMASSAGYYAPYLLRRIGTPAATQALILVAKNSPDAGVRRVAISSLAGSQDPAVPTILLDALGSGDNDLAQTAWSSLQNVKLGDAHLPAILKLKNAGNWTSVVPTLLARVGTPAALTELESVARAEANANTRRLAILELGKLADAKYAPVFFAGLLSDDSNVLSASWESIRKLKLTDAHLPGILTVLGGKYRTMVPALLAQVGTPAARKVLADIANGAHGPEVRTRAEATEVLARLGDVKYRDFFLALLKDPEVNVFTQAWQGLTPLKLTDAQLPAIRALKGSYHGDRSRLDLLERISTPASRALIVEIASDPKDRMAIEAFRAIGQRGACEQLAPLKLLLTRNEGTDEYRRWLASTVQTLEQKYPNCR